MMGVRVQSHLLELDRISLSRTGLHCLSGWLCNGNGLFLQQNTMDARHTKQIIDWSCSTLRDQGYRRNTGLQDHFEIPRWETCRESGQVAYSFFLLCWDIFWCPQEAGFWRLDSRRFALVSTFQRVLASDVCYQFPSSMVTLEPRSKPCRKWKEQKNIIEHTFPLDFGTSPSLFLFHVALFSLWYVGSWCWDVHVRDPESRNNCAREQLLDSYYSSEYRRKRFPIKTQRFP